MNLLLAGAGALILTDLDKRAEAWLVAASPEWLTALTPGSSERGFLRAHGDHTQAKHFILRSGAPFLRNWVRWDVIPHHRYGRENSYEEQSA